MRRKQSLSALLGYFMFFALIVVITSVAVLVYSFVADKSKAVIAVVMICVISVLAGLCTLFDYIRRKLKVDTPLNEILGATDRIAGGDFGIHLQTRHPFNRYDGYDCIMENVNKMASELSKNEVLKTDFISNVSHEIKTPLSIIQNYASLLKCENISAGERAEYADILVSATKRLNNLIMNILKLNKLENQEIKPDIELVNLGETVAEAVLQFESIIESKHIELDCDIDDVRIKTSPSYLETVWNNLISNAVKFTPEGGKITVKLKEEDGFAVFSVTDTGCGMSKETGRHIFDKFYQGDTSHSQEGNGLGLALVKKVIDVLGGEIAVESVVNKGSTFTVKLVKQP